MATPSPRAVASGQRLSYEMYRGPGTHVIGGPSFVLNLKSQRYGAFDEPSSHSFLEAAEIGLRSSIFLKTVHFLMVL